MGVTTRNKAAGLHSGPADYQYFLRYPSVPVAKLPHNHTTAAEMAWITRLSEDDYSAGKLLGTSLIIHDTRNQRSHLIDAEGIQHIVKRIGFIQPDKLWISTAIQMGYLPHPYDEFT